MNDHLIGEASYVHKGGRWYITLNVPRWLLDDIEAEVRKGVPQGLVISSSSIAVSNGETSRVSITFATLDAKQGGAS